MHELVLLVRISYIWLEFIDAFRPGQNPESRKTVVIV